MVTERIDLAAVLGKAALLSNLTPAELNLLAARTVLPTLLGQHAAGEHWLACAVVAIPDPARWDRVWAACPTCPAWFSELAEPI